MFGGLRPRQFTIPVFFEDMICVDMKPVLKVPEPIALGHCPVELFRSEKALMTHCYGDSDGRVW
eukprot:12888797-Prorocentrum_lima.AAC.1